MKELKKAFSLLIMTVWAVEQLAVGDKQGEAKKAQAIDAIDKAVDQLLPDWLSPVVRTLSALLIDAMVAFAKKTGFFGWFSGFLNEKPAT